jgi:hypothetical protein
MRRLPRSDPKVDSKGKYLMLELPNRAGGSYGPRSLSDISVDLGPAAAWLLASAGARPAELENSRTIGFDVSRPIRQITAVLGSADFGACFVTIDGIGTKI